MSRGDEPVTVSRIVPGDEAWALFKKELEERPECVEKMLDAPGLARSAREHLPKPPVKITQVRAAYLKHCSATEKSKKEALAPFDRLVQFAEARTLEDLTEGVRANWRIQIVNHSGLKSSGTIAGYFSRVRNVLRFAARGELDVAQIEAAIGRCKAKLYSPPNNVHDHPQPISREHFHKLVETAR